MQVAPDVIQLPGKFEIFNPQLKQTWLKTLLIKENRAIKALGYDSEGKPNFNGKFRDSWGYDTALLPDLPLLHAACLANSASYGKLKVHSTTITRYGSSVGHIALHADNANLGVGGVWQRTPLGNRAVTCVYYLTSQVLDHQGGELEIPNATVRYSPKAGELVMFPSSPQFAHRVAESRGLRCVISVFLEKAND